MKTVTWIAAGLVAWAAMGLAQGGVPIPPVPQGPPNADFPAAFPNQTRAPRLGDSGVSSVVLVRGLEHPWGIAELPDGRFLVTERPGRLRLVTLGQGVSAPISGVPGVDARRQGGLLDVAVAPDFDRTRRVWLTYAKPVPGGTVTAAGWGVLSEDGTALEGFRDIFVQTPPSPTPMHFGSRIVFEPGTGHAFITTGEHSRARERVLAQDDETTYGKVVRVDALTGAPVPGNPYIGGPGLDVIWSTGHRNPQGAAIGPDGALWTIEHGPRGGDELNRPGPGDNHGWPVVSYGIEYDGGLVGSGQPRAEGFVEPVYFWDPVIAPGGMEFYAGDRFPEWQGDLLIGGLVAAAVVRLKIEGGRVAGEERLIEGVGRVRDVEVTSGGEVLVLIDAPNGEIRQLTR